MSLYALLSCLFGLGLVTGFVGTITGGSALMTIPAMVLLGINPQSAIASARIAAMGTMVAGLPQFHRRGMVDYRIAWPAALLGIIGAILGAQLLFSVSEVLLKRSIGLITLTFFALSFWKAPVTEEKQPSRAKQSLGYSLFLLAGLLGGFFGGQAILSTYILSLCFDKSLMESVGTRKASGLAIAIAAVIIYGVHGTIEWTLSLALVLGTLIGSTFGSAYALKKGDRWIGWLFNAVVILASVKMLFF